ncbi:Histone-fold domain containing protein [Cordyceps militaris CM01]|uniref:Histone-fold domain containing protein n=1 Tax=Cordyceps militaris (strain CM01) TaxID=983644 RepID=G3JMA4_CORMM|nr:Histone-fold domain containing protein [Cordyceps militaris CM01]EGX89992.1 Histone-fold domain containing protein [Cordyceps militaris CM01]
MADTPTRGSSRPARTPAGRTPSQRTPSGRVTNPDSTVHTPLDRSGPRELADSVRRGLSASGRKNNNNAPTPHATAARRALEQRRTAMFTPGKNRRRSLREQHQTPMNILNQLARRLAPSTQQVAASSSPAERGPQSSLLPIGEREEPDDEDDYMDDEPDVEGDYDDDDDDEDLPAPPRLSLALQEDEDDTIELRPPRLSVIPDDNITNHTVGSVELPREYRDPGWARGSLGSVRGSDYFDPNDPTVEMTGRPSDFFNGSLLADLQDRADDNAVAFQRGRFENDPTMRTIGRESEFTIGVPPDMGDQTTFMFSEPGGDAPATSPLPGTSATAAAARAGGDTTYGNVSLALDNPDGEDLPPFGDDDEDNHQEREPIDYDEPTNRQHGDEQERDAESGRRRASALADGETLISEGEDSDPADVTIRQHNTSLAVERSAPARRGPKSKKKQKRISRHGAEYPPLPPAFVRRVAHRAVQTSGLSNHRITSDVLAALTQASEWFFEQLGDDLGAYADHAKRTVIEESDVLTLMKRQRQIGSDATLFSLAQRHLPRELLQDLRMPQGANLKGQLQKSFTQYDEDEDDASEVS